MKRIYYNDAKRTVDYNFSQGDQLPLGCCEGVDQIVVPLNSQSGTDHLNFVFNINHAHFTLQTGASALVLAGTMTSVPNCTSYACSAAGGMEYTDGFHSLENALPHAATEFFHSVRLADFKSFSSEKYNAFTYGFQGNNLDGADSYPQARITAKWIKGFYCGRLFTGELVLENAVFTRTARLWSFAVANGGGYAIPGLTDPTTAVVDLAIEAVAGGTEVNFYYRAGGAAMAMDKASGGWTKYATYTATGTAFYGYPVNKGMLTLNAADLAYPGDVPNTLAINQNKEIVVSETTSQTASAGDLAREYRVVSFEPVGNKKRIVYSCTPGSLTVIRSKFSGPDKTPAELNVVKLRPNGQSVTFRSYLTSFAGAASGNWAIGKPWVAENQNNHFVLSNEKLSAGVEYYLYLFITDNDPVYDLNTTSGVIEDPAVLGVGSPSIGSVGISPSLLLLDNSH